MSKLGKESRREKRINKKYENAEAKIAKGYSKSKKKGDKQNAKRGYNYDSAIKAGLGPDETGHWPSRNPDTGEILKGRKHPTYGKTKKGEKAAGYKMYKKEGKTFSKPRKK